MNARTEHPNPALDSKIKNMLQQLDAEAPAAPSLDELRLTVPASAPSGPNWFTIGAAASIVALGVGGLVVIGARDETPVSDRPGETIPAVDGTTGASDSLPVEEPSVGTAPADLVDAPEVAPEPIGLGDPLIGAALPAEAIPMFEIDQPNWVKQYVFGTDQQPLGDITTNMVVMVGEGGPTYDQPMASVSVFDAGDLDITDLGDPIEARGVAAAVNVYDNNPETGLTGATVNLTVPLDDGLALRVNSVRLDVAETVAIADQVSIAADDQVEFDAPDGFRLLSSTAPDTWRNFSYRWGFDDGTPVPDPVVISSPTASETIPQQPSIEVIGSNLGSVSLSGRIGLEVRENRVVNGVDVAFRPQPNEPGLYWVDWLDGDWAYYVIGQNLESEEQFFDLLESLRIADAETFATSNVEPGGVAVMVPGRHDDLVADILGDLDLTADQLDRAATVSMPTSMFHYQFELYSGVGCVAAQRWLDADLANDELGRVGAMALVDAVVARPDDATGLPSTLGFEGLVDSMRQGTSTDVAGFGSNDCPLWSR